MPAKAGPLSLECLKFGQRMLYECEREVFIDYGRSLKPDLLLGQWNHLYCYFCDPWHETFSQLNGDERCVLPDELWAKGEDWVMYSIVLSILEKLRWRAPRQYMARSLSPPATIVSSRRLPRTADFGCFVL